MYRLIIVDDEFEIRDSMVRLFPWQDMGFEVVGHFDNGAEALEFIRGHPVDVVLTDIRMPVMTGIELAEKLRQEYPDMAIVFLSAYRDFTYAQEAIRHGVSGYIVKPTGYRQLSEMFGRVKSEMDKEKSAAIMSKPSAGYYDSVVSAVKRYVEENYRQATLTGAAERVSMNPQYLSHFFKQHAGVKFFDFLQNVRMDSAATMLKDAAYRIGEVSDLVGYKNQNNFSRAFRLHFQMTPREYRLRHYGIDRD